MMHSFACKRAIKNRNPHIAGSPVLVIVRQGVPGRTSSV